MAYEIEVAEGNIDTPLTIFPNAEKQVDPFERMSDVSAGLLPLVVQYNTYYQAGNIAAANQLLETNTELKNCIFSANGYNKLRDAIIAIEYYLYNQIADLYNNITAEKYGINDNPTEGQASNVSYSAEKVQPLFDTRNITLNLSNWSDSAPYTQTVVVNGVKSDYRPTIACRVADVTTEAEQKKIEKSWGYVNSVVVNDGTITATCKFKKPISDIPLVIKGA